MYSIENRENLKKCFSESLVCKTRINDQSVVEAVKHCYTKLDLSFTPCVEQCTLEYVVGNYNQEAHNTLSCSIGEINVGLCYYNCEIY